MEQRDLYAESFMLAWEHIEEMDIFTADERARGYEPMKAKIYELMEAGETDPLKLATAALSWFRDQTQVDRSADRIISRAAKK